MIFMMNKMKRAMSIRVAANCNLTPYTIRVNHENHVNPVYGFFCETDLPQMFVEELERA
jgi:hypothetical protein